MATVHDKMDATQSAATIVENEMTDKQQQNSIQNENKATDQMKSTKANISNSQQLDKFKRRLIRAVARLNRKKKPEKEMWQELEEEIGCDCKMLWLHMRALTLKKLRRLLPANDLLENITKVAQFTATDWLLFDLILVHENVDVISAVDLEKTDPARGQLELDKYTEPECLHELFDLVITHKVQHLTGDELTEAWIRITVAYNSRGRQVSPMLLQLRWYQMQELCRVGFYNFWYSYRGNAKLLPVALATKPTQLQTKIAQQFSSVVTQNFSSWNKRIQERRVILSEEFAHTWEKQKKAVKDLEEKETEIEVIEPQVETIDLDAEESVKNSDSALKSSIDDSNSNYIEQSVSTLSDNQTSETSIRINTVKTEIQDEVLEIDGLSDVEATEIPLEASNSDGNRENSYENSISIPVQDYDIVSNITLPTIASVIGNAVDVDKSNTENEINSILEQKARNLSNKVPAAIENEDAVNTMYESDSEMEEILREKASGLMNIEITRIKSECDVQQIDGKNTSKETLKSKSDVIRNNNEFIDCDSDDEMNRLLQEKAEQFKSTKEHQPKDTASKEKKYFENKKSNKFVAETTVTLEAEIDKKINMFTNEDTTKESNIDGLEETYFDDDGIEFEDDGIEFVDEGIEFVDDKEQSENKNNKINTDSISDSNVENKNDNEDEPKIDLKLLMDPIVYTKKLDQMEVFKFTDFNFVNDTRVINCALLESKPVDKRAVKDEDIKKFRDQAVLGLSEEDGQNEDSKDDFKEDLVRRYETGDTQTDNEEQLLREESNKKVKSTSWLLQKPKQCSYNPIQLCKNPDFNTRLKRFTAGFLSLPRNRELLKKIKPLTIDLHKAFEIKLVNNTLNVKNDSFKSFNATAMTIKNKPQETIISAKPQESITNATYSTENISTQTPVQCYEKNKEGPRVPPKAQEGLLSERRKIINLPDIDQVRRVNQSLLTAEVTPISIDNKTNKTNSSKFELLPKESVEKVATITTPTSQNEVETTMPELDVKNISLSNMESRNVELHSTSNTYIMAHKISDQIIDISNQMSKFDKDPIDKNDTFHTNVNTMSKRFKTNVNKKVEKKNTKYPYFKEPKTVAAEEEKSWMAKYVSNCFADSLLTPDTVNKILFLIKNAEEDTQAVETKSLENFESDTKLKKPVIEDSKCTELVDCNDAIKRQKQKKQKVNRTKQLKPEKYKGIFCCWAREKMSFLSLKRTLKGHGCVKFKCQCCCRHELNKMKLLLRSKYSNNKNINTIVLSDDEDLIQNLHSFSSTQINISNDNIQNSVINDSIDTKNTNQSSRLCKSTAGQSEHGPLIVSETPSVSASESNEMALKLPNVHPVFKVTAGPNKSYATSKENDGKTIKFNQTVDPISPRILPKIVNTHSEAVQLPKKPIIIETPLQKNETSVKKCKAVVLSTEGHPYKEPTEISAEVQSNQDISSHSISHQNDIPASIDVIPAPRKKINVKLPPKRIPFGRKKPIFIGKNKILLCDLKKKKHPETTLQLPTLPNGINFMVLPNGDLTLSIAPGVELNSSILSALTPIMALVQNQLKRNKFAVIIDKTREEPKLTIDGNKILSLGIDAIEPVQLIESQTIDVNCPNPKIEINIHQAEQIKNADVSYSVDIKSNINNTENIIPTTDLKNPHIEINTNTHLENETGEILNDLESDAVDSRNTNSLLAHNQSKNEVNSENKSDADTNLVNSRKSLLSDLMEMSGISAEDACVVPDTNVLLNANASAVDETLPVGCTDPDTKPVNNADNSDLTILGPETNLLLFEPTDPINYLLNCVGIVRPELNAITSFAELKYTYENHGKFYKLDVETSSIVPINVMLKKNSNTLIGATTRYLTDVIDLTDDNDITQDKDNTQEKMIRDKDIGEINPKKHDDATIHSEISNNFSFQVVATQKNQQKKIAVKPIKLFKAVHSTSPSILRRSLKSIINTGVPTSAPMKLTPKGKTQLCKIGNKIITVELDSESNCSTVESEVPPLKYFNSSDDSSDDEPLAKKSKRLKAAATHNEGTTETVPVNNEIIEEAIDVPDDTQNDDTEIASDSEIHDMMEIEGINPELHPVAFEEGSESEDDMCILGV